MTAWPWDVCFTPDHRRQRFPAQRLFGANNGSPVASFDYFVGRGRQRNYGKRELD
jgi:hypothetical protein